MQKYSYEQIPATEIIQMIFISDWQVNRVRRGSPVINTTVALAEDWFYFLAPTRCSKVSLTPIPGNPIPSSDFHRCQACTCTCIHAGKILTYIKINSLKSMLGMVAHTCSARTGATKEDQGVRSGETAQQSVSWASMKT